MDAGPAASWRQPWAVGGLVGLALLAFGGAVGTDGAPADLEGLLRDLQLVPLTGAPPAFELAGLDGRTETLEQLRGQVVLLYFWATW